MFQFAGLDTTIQFPVMDEAQTCSVKMSLVNTACATQYGPAISFVSGQIFLAIDVYKIIPHGVSQSLCLLE